MPRGENYYVIKFQNELIDNHDHFMVMGLDSDAKPRKYLEQMQLHNPNIKIDLRKDLDDAEFKKSLPTFGTKMEADAEAKRLSEIADQANPDRIGLDKVYPEGETNRALHVGAPQDNQSSVQMPPAAPAQ